MQTLSLTLHAQLGRQRLRPPIGPTCCPLTAPLVCRRAGVGVTPLSDQVQQVLGSHSPFVVAVERCKLRSTGIQGRHAAQARRVCRHSATTYVAGLLCHAGGRAGAMWASVPASTDLVSATATRRGVGRKGSGARACVRTLPASGTAASCGSIDTSVASALPASKDGSEPKSLNRNFRLSLLTAPHPGTGQGVIAARAVRGCKHDRATNTQLSGAGILLSAGCKHPPHILRS
jgi:hypothetical protein